MREWQSPWETGLLTAIGDCCDRPNLFVAGTACDGSLLAALMRCASCERFCFPPTIGSNGGNGPARWGKAAVWHSTVRFRAVAQAYGAI